MTPTDLTRAALYARSVAWAEAQNNARLAAALTRRGIALAGDRWPAEYDRATGRLDPDPEPRPDRSPTRRTATGV